ncbi:MAG TPA: amidohydrolase family protein [Solirubrobacteraceae bacterium]|jgi:predicted TIM-barrel fold metal-dependent hydrolase|nr:amidohydrolase family protein [Solirubrobacteraceae bacterium]
MIDVDAVMRPFWDRFQADYGPLPLFDAHTHVGADDPDGVRQSPDELLAALARADARAVVFPMHEPAGYPPANDRVLEAAERSGGTLVAYCRVDPHDNAVAEARRCLDAGARGIKLHPRAERFTLSAPAVRELVALAHERRAPVLIHAGRGIPALGRDTVALSGEFPEARLILAHAAISDLAWLWRVLPDHPNLLIDTAWWDPADMMALFTLVPPGNIVWASDSPYGLPLTSAVMHLRLAAQAGLEPAVLRAIAGAQMEHVLAGGDPLDLGPPPRTTRPIDPLLERVISHACQAVARVFVRVDPSEAVALAKLACGVGQDSPDAAIFAAVLELLELYEEHVTPRAPGERISPAARFLIAAVAVARSPDVPLPDLPDAPPPTREEAER